MSDQPANNRALSLALALLFLGLSASTGFQPEIRGELEDENLAMETHSGLNFPGSTVGSIYSLTAIGAAYNYTCVVMDNNEMKCWGRGSQGYLGNGNDANTHSPIGVNQVDSQSCCITDVVETSPDGHHTPALTSNGTVYLWGEDAWGQIGHGHISCFGSCWNPHGPSVMAGSRTFVTVVTGIHHTCAITEPDMGVWCWGNNEVGQLGTGDNNARNAPTQIELPAGRHAVSINAAFDSTCVLLDNGSGMCWGKNVNGNLGDGTYNDRNAPSHISILPTNRSIVALDLGPFHTCAILDDGTVNCWGTNEYGTFGDGSTNNSTYPRAAQLPTGRTAISIDAGLGHTCAILDDSSAACWGRNDYGQLGDGTTNNSTTPVIVSMPSGLGVAEISAGSRHTCAVATNASVYCWGAHEEGSLGLGEGVDSDVPAYVDLGTGRHAIMSERDNDADGIVNIFDPFPDGCPEGTYASDDTCIDASPGYYADGISPYEQFPCNPGTFQPTSGQTSCISASPGHYVGEQASISQTQCTPGTYQPDYGQDSCLDASPGNYSSGDASIRQTQCSSGTYQPSPGASVCLTASPGHFVANFGAHQQTPCPAGTYQMLPGTTSCFDTNPGFYAASEGSTAQDQCPSGTYSSQIGQSNCTDASPGHYAIGLQQTSQSPCQPGEFQPAAGEELCLATYPGYYSDTEGTVEQIPCAPGTYQDQAGQTSCLEAEPGNYTSDPGSTSQTPCSAGTFSDAPGQSECTEAEPGNYVDLDGATDQTPCPPGQYQSENGSQGCEDPPPGQTASPDGSSTSACPAGKYKPEGQEICMDASPGHFVNETGSASQTPCDPGTFQEEPGQTVCGLTDPGNYASASGSSSQTPCPKGEYQPYGGQETCNPAMPGHHVPEEGASSQTSCKSGKYQPSEGQDSCITADPGNFVVSTGATSQTPCQPGSFQPASGAIGCQPADSGHFVSEAGAAEQTKCPSGEEQQMMGQTACTKVERPLWMAILMYGVPAVVFGTMAVLYISSKKKSGGGGRGKAYMYSEDLRKKG